MTEIAETPEVTTLDRIRAIEDRLEIHTLLTTHGAAVDAGAADFWIDRWTEDSWVQRPADPGRHSGDYEGRYGRDDLRDEINSPELEALRETGLSHLNTAPIIELDGDTAIATNYTTLVKLHDNAYNILMVVVNRWTLRRENGWKITSRTIEAVGHGDAARKLLLQATRDR